MDKKAKCSRIAFRITDLSPLDFFLWGHLKFTKLIKTKDQIILQISFETLRNVRQRFKQNLWSFIEVGGPHFEHLVIKQLIIFLNDEELDPLTI